MRCSRCLLQHCLCAEVPAIATRTRVVIVRHHLEMFRASNTGRLANLALVNSELVDHPTQKLVAPEGAWLVYPEGPVTERIAAEPPKAIVVLDATWSQARRMYRKIDALRGMPLLHLPEMPMPSARLRESPAPGKVSTIEAIARALRMIEGDASAEPLEALFDLAVARAAQSGRQMR
jgi:DTW domain-containing protein